MAPLHGFTSSGAFLALCALSGLDTAAGLSLDYHVGLHAAVRAFQGVAGRAASSDTKTSSSGLSSTAGTSFAGFSMFSNGSLSSLNLTSACEAALYQTVDCADEAASLMTSGYVGSFENATETALVCDAGCEASVAQLHDAVAASCVGSSANLIDGMPFVDLVDLFWSNWNQSCFVDSATGTNCNDLVDTYMNVTDVADMPQSELCSYCMTEKLAMMQADAYASAYDSNWQAVYEEVAAQCKLTVSDLSAAPSAFNVSVPVAAANCVSGHTYTTADGDTCDSIALARGVSAATMFYTNPDLHNCSALDAGTALCLPQTCSSVYAVQANDTCSSIAADNGLLTRQVVSYNSLLAANCSNLHAANPYWGSVLCVSTPGGTYNGTAPGTATSAADDGNDDDGDGDAAAVVSAPDGSTVAPGTTTDCGGWWVAGGGGDGGLNLTCAQVCLNYEIAINEFTAANPSLNKTTCDADLVGGDAYCVDPLAGWQYPNATADTTTTATATSTATASATVSALTSTATPTAAEPGTAAGCDVWYYVVDNDTCYSIAQSFGITLDQFYAWNSEVGSDCAGLWLSAYVCVGVE